MLDNRIAQLVFHIVIRRFYIQITACLHHQPEDPDGLQDCVVQPHLLSRSFSLTTNKMNIDQHVNKQSARDH